MRNAPGWAKRKNCRPRLETLESRRLLATFSVTNIDDTGPGSFRQAILDANAAPGSDAIAFAIPGDGVHTIRPATALPAVTGPTAIDGSTQPGYAGTPVVEIDGSTLVPSVNAGLSIRGGNSVVRALTINRLGPNGTGIELAGPGGNRIDGCYIGVGSDGQQAALAPNGSIWIHSSPNNTIGGATAAARNVFATGISVSGDSATGNVIQGNSVGLDATGTRYIGAINTHSTSGIPVFGIYVDSPGTTIGGPGPGEGNHIEGGVTIAQPGSTTAIGPRGTTVQGNTIGGLDRWATGVAIWYTDHITIGGPGPGMGNTILGTGDGTVGGITIFQSSDIVVQGNTISGLGGAGIAAVGDRITIGGRALGEGNVVLHNGNGPDAEGGIRIVTGRRNTVVGNLIRDNQAYNFTFGGDFIYGELMPGAWPWHPSNDLFDGDSGPNDLLNFPIVTSATLSGGRVQVFGSYQGKPNLALTLDFYAAPTGGPGGDAQASVYLGSTGVTTDADGNANYLFEPATALPVGWLVTATATDADGNTSEFATPAAVADTPAGSIAFDAATAVVDEANGYARITVTRGGGSGIATVAYSTADGSALAGADYTATSGRLIFGPLESSKVLLVPVTADTLHESDETFTLTLSGPGAGASLGALASTRVTIVNDDVPRPAANSVGFADPQQRVNEGAGSVTVRVVRTGGTGAFQAAYRTGGGTAVAGRDYIYTGGVLTFEAGETLKTFQIPIAGDPGRGPNKTIGVTVGLRGSIDDLPSPSISLPFSTETLTLVDLDRPRAAGAIADYDGDGRTDLLSFRGDEDSHWLGTTSLGFNLDAHFGDHAHGDVPVPGDYDGDGKSDLAVFRPDQALWIMQLSGGGTRTVQMGDPTHGDQPVARDYDADGITDLAVFRPESATWIVRLSTGGVKTSQMGDPRWGDIPAPADYDGDGKADLAVFRPSTATWIIRKSSGGSRVEQMGEPDLVDLPVPGDYDGDGLADLAIFRPSSATWIIRKSSGGVVSEQAPISPPAVPLVAPIDSFLARRVEIRPPSSIGYARGPVTLTAAAKSSVPTTSVRPASLATPRVAARRATTRAASWRVERG